MSDKKIVYGEFISFKHGVERRTLETSVDDEEPEPVRFVRLQLEIAGTCSGVEYPAFDFGEHPELEAELKKISGLSRRQGAVDDE